MFCLSGTIFRLKGCVLTMSFLDCNGALIPYLYEAWKDENKQENKEKQSEKERWKYIKINIYLITIR